MDKTLIIFLLILFLSFSFINKSLPNLFLYRDFCNPSNSFLPAAQFYSSDKKISSFFNGQLIYYKKNISPYKYDSVFPDIIVYKSESKYIGFTNILYPEEKININEQIEFNDNFFHSFIIENKIFLNPLKYLKPSISSSVSIINVYYLNEEDVAVAFRQNYKNNIIPILIYTYSTYLSGKFAYISNVYNIEIYLDDEIIYERKLDTISKKKIIELISTSSKPQFIKYIISNVSDGEHILKVRVYDFSGNFKEIQKKFNVKSY
ncbi:MAG: hypothetical protein ACK4YF_01880 [Exilispira sp.]